MPVRFGLIAVLVVGLASDASAQTPEPVRALELPSVHATQVAVSYLKGEGEIRFRATIIARGRSDLTLLTAAHCLGPGDVGRQITLRRGDDLVQTRVLAVARNPSYGTTPQGEVPGADNAPGSGTLARTRATARCLE